jgi:hypothetical protein
MNVLKDRTLSQENSYKQNKKKTIIKKKNQLNELEKIKFLEKENEKLHFQVEYTNELLELQKETIQKLLKRIEKLENHKVHPITKIQKSIFFE